MKIWFDKTFYSEIAIKRAIKDYAPLAEIKMNSTPECCICTISRSKYPMKTTILEFSNYVLNLSVMSEKKNDIC